MSYLTLFAEQVPSLLDESDTVVFDIRDRGSFDREHLPGAQPVDDAIINLLIRVRNTARPILVYCYHGNSSRDLCQLLAGFGFTRVYNLDDGWLAWAGYRDRLEVQLTGFTRTWMHNLGFNTSNLNARINNGMSALMVAAVQSQTDIVKELLNAGADVNLLNNDRNAALWFACICGDTSVIKQLISHDADIDNQNVNGATCLIYAASTGKYSIVKTLIDAGADIGRQTRDGFNALDAAATLPVLRLLKPYYAVTGTRGPHPSWRH